MSTASTAVNMPNARPKRLFFTGCSSSGCTTLMRSRSGGRSLCTSGRRRGASRSSTAVRGWTARCELGLGWLSWDCLDAGVAARSGVRSGRSLGGSGRALRSPLISPRSGVRSRRDGSGEASPISRRTLSSRRSSSSSSERPWKSNTFFSSLMPQPPLRCHWAPGSR